MTFGMSGGIIIGNGKKALDGDREYLGIGNGILDPGSASGLEMYNMFRQAMELHNTYITQFRTALFSVLYSKHDIDMR
jgi:hypothetical protein